MDEEVFLDQLLASERLPHWLQILRGPSSQPRYCSWQQLPEGACSASNPYSSALPCAGEQLPWQSLLQSCMLGPHMLQRYPLRQMAFSRRHLRCDKDVSVNHSCLRLLVYRRELPALQP